MHNANTERGKAPQKKHALEVPFNGMPSGARTLLIAADVDGTFLDSHGRAALPALALRHALLALSETHNARVLLAFASSRTLRELLVLQRAIGIAGPCIAEDGAVVAVDTGSSRGTGSSGGTGPDHGVAERWQAAARQHLGAEEQLRAGRRQLRLWRLAESTAMLRARFRESIAPYELNPADLDSMQRIGFRSAAAVRRALVQREGSILLDLQHAGDGARTALLQTAAESGSHVHCGGRWHTLTHGAGKGPALAFLRGLLTAPAEQPSPIETAGASGIAPNVPHVVAIGNEENDESLLAGADVGFAICNPRAGVHPRLAAIPGVIPLVAEGTRGFTEMLERLMSVSIFSTVRT